MLLFVKYLKICVSSFLHPAKVFMKGSKKKKKSSVLAISIICKLAEGEFTLFHLLSHCEALKQCWTQYRALECTSDEWPSAGLCPLIITC